MVMEINYLTIHHALYKFEIYDAKVWIAVLNYHMVVGQKEAQCLEGEDLATFTASSNVNQIMVITGYEGWQSRI